MFRRVLPGREKEALEFLAREPEVNHFILGDIECFGLDDPNLALWVEEKCSGISSALLRYYGSFIIYAPGGADSKHAARIMRDSGFGMLSGRPEYVQPILEHLGLMPHLSMNILLRLAPGSLRPSGVDVGAINVDYNHLDQYLDGIVDLRRNIVEFPMGINVEALKDEMKLGCKRILIAAKDGKTVSMAMTTVERSQAAMIVSVCTRSQYRGQGYAPALMTALCKGLEAEGKTGILFYSNPVAGRIYTALGFEDIGRWCFASFN